MTNCKWCGQPHKTSSLWCSISCYIASRGDVHGAAQSRFEQLEAELQEALMQSFSNLGQTETRAALERAINASYAGDVPDLAQGVLFNLEMDGWRLVRKESQENNE